MAGQKIKTSSDKKKQGKKPATSVGKKKKSSFFICRFFRSDPHEYAYLKFLLGLVFGAFLGLAFYIGVVERMTFENEERRFQFGGAVALLMSLGYAFSVQVRCTLILVIPLFCGKHGRRIINAYAITLLLTGHPCVVSTTSVRNPTDLGARRHAVEVEVHVKLFLRAVCGFTTRACEYGRRAWPRTCRAEEARVSTASLRLSCNRTEIVRCKHVQLTTCATYDARNRSRPDLACRPHSYTLRNRANDVRVTCVDATPSPRPMANMLTNAKESSRSITCSSQLAFEQSKVVMKFMAAPLMDTMKDLQKEKWECCLFGLSTTVVTARLAQSVEHGTLNPRVVDLMTKPRTISILRKYGAPIEGNTFEVTNHGLPYRPDDQSQEQSRFCANLMTKPRTISILRKYGAPIDDITFEVTNHGLSYRTDDQSQEQSRFCANLMAKAKNKCETALRNMKNHCYLTIGWTGVGLIVCFYFESMDTCAAVSSSMCSDDKAVDKGFGKSYDSSGGSVKELDKHFDAKMEYQIISRPKNLDLKTAEDVGLAIDQEFRQRMAVFRFFSAVINKIFAFLFVLTLLSAHTYQRKFCTKFDFDNLYITGYFRRIDARRRRAGKRTLLPLKKAEENEIIYPTKMKLMSHEKAKLTKGLILVFGQVVFALVVFFLDYLLFESLDIIRRHSLVTTTMKGHHQLSVKVLGSGAIAKIMKTMFRSMHNQAHTLHHVSTNKPCLPQPTQLDPWYLWIVLGSYIAQIGLYYIEAYALRLRRVIASFFYRRRAKKRTLHLYNEFMRKRVGFLTHMRKKIRRLVREKKLSVETALPTILRYKFPHVFFWLKWLGLGKKQCLICDEKENKFTHHCPACRYVYCRQCWRDMKKTCYNCDPAYTSEDTQTSDKSSSSEDD
ncbi:DC-STAMP domain-containing protein 1 [Branchiostoma belcheri]|nr:DC-STAMP domain-containing protein 1 [Branchiostoma belcheri]